VCFEENLKKENQGAQAGRTCDPRVENSDVFESQTPYCYVWLLSRQGLHLLDFRILA
jgi:hypothetical protein